jgi:hypothetical protein
MESARSVTTDEDKLRRHKSALGLGAAELIRELMTTAEEIIT